MRNDMFPMFVGLRNRRCVVVGAGPVAEAKIEDLMQRGAEVIVIAPDATPRVQQWSRDRRLIWHDREFAPNDMERAFIAVAATSSAEVNHTVAAEARARGVLCNVVDDPEYCDFFYPAVVQRGALQIAISTSGASPALARRLREQLEKQFGPEYEEWLREVDEQRRTILSSTADPQQRRAMLESLVSEESFRAFLKRKHGA